MANRGSELLYLKEEGLSATNVKGELSLIVKATKPISMGTESTYYSCTKHKVPSDKNYWATNVEPVIAAASLKNNHHMILYACDGEEDPYPTYHDHGTSVNPNTNFMAN